MNPRHLILTAGSVLLPGSLASADTLRVPADFPTIQGAIQAAGNGDRIEVSAGTYLENLDFLGKDVAVVAVGDASSTVIDGGGTTSTVTFASEEGPGAILRGFTITNGGGTSHGGFVVGGNVYVLGASPSLHDNVITASQIVDYGGGVYLEQSQASLRGNTISAHVVGRDGGGICFFDSAPSIVGNVVLQNSAVASEGGGIYGEGAGVVDSLGEVRDNTIRLNVASAGAGINLRNGLVTVCSNRIRNNQNNEDSGGGLVLATCDGLVEDNDFDGNVGFFKGSALTVWGASPVVIRGNRFVNHASSSIAHRIGSSTAPRIEDNVITGWSAVELESGSASIVRGNTMVGTGLGTGVILEGPGIIEDNVISGFSEGVCTFLSPTGFVVRRNTIHGNLSGIGIFSGSGEVSDNLLYDNSVYGIYCSGTPQAFLRNTIAGGDLGMVVTDSSSVTVESSILWGHATAAIQVDSGSIAVSYSDVQGGFPGVGNLDVDPGFLDPAGGQYALPSTSPCLDRGNPADDPCLLFDLAGTPRALDGILDGSRRVDQGAHEFSHVRLDVTGNFTPGGSLTLDTTGTAGLTAFLLVSVDTAVACHPRFGTFGIDFSFWLSLPWGPIPSSVTVPLGAALPTPLPLVFQQVALGAGAGNTSNVVSIVIE